MVADPSCALRRWFVALESCHDGYVGRTTGAVGAITAAGWECTAGSELQDCDSSATTTPSASMVDMRVLGKPSNFPGEEPSWKSWSFVMYSFSAAVSPELGALTEKARTTADDMRNVNLTPAEQV